MNKKAKGEKLNRHPREEKEKREEETEGKKLRNVSLAGPCDNWITVAVKAPEIESCDEVREFFFLPSLLLKTENAVRVYGVA